MSLFLSLTLPRAHLDFSRDFDDSPPFAEIDEIRVVEEDVRIPVLDLRDVGQIHPQEGNAGRIDRTQLLRVFLKVRLVQVFCVVQTFD